MLGASFQAAILTYMQLRQTRIFVSQDLSTQIDTQ